MFKKVSALMLMLVLLLASAPLVLAQVTEQQQDVSQNQPTQPGQQDLSQNQPTQSGEQNTSQNQPTQSPTSSLKDITELDANNNLVVNCGALVDRFAHFPQIGLDKIANDPNLQLEMMQATDLVQLCTDEGFPNNGQPSSATPTNSGQPSNTMPTNGEQSINTTPTNSSTQSPQVAPMS